MTSAAVRHRAGWLINLVTRLLAVLALGYLLYAVVEQWGAIASWRPTFTQLAELAGLVLAYGASLFLLAENWHQLMRGCNAEAPSRRVTYPSFTRTQVAKYLPGNVIHFVGRHVVLRRAGIGHKALLLGLVCEIAICVIAASAVAAGLYVVVPLSDVSEISGLVNGVAIYALVAIVLVFVLAVLAIRLGLLPVFPKGPRLPRTLVVSAGLCVAFFAIFGLIFLAIGHMLFAATSAHLIAAATLAWTVGFVVPGAPGGLGPRELALVFLLQGVLSEPDALISTALFRLVTMLGDGVLLAASYVVGFRVASNEDPSADTRGRREVADDEDLRQTDHRHST